VQNPNKDKILYKELSYKVVGALYDAIKSLGSSYHEKYYQRAIEQFLLKREIVFKREVPIEIVINEKTIGKHYLDFLVDNLIILEIKKGNRINMSDIKQVLMYLKTTNLKLGILAYFGTRGVIYKRIVNNFLKQV
jgi:GxxExxY protein